MRECERERIVGLLAKSFSPVRQTCGRVEAGGAALCARSPLMLAHVSPCVLLYALVVQHGPGTSAARAMPCYSMDLSQALWVTTPVQFLHPVAPQHRSQHGGLRCARRGGLTLSCMRICLFCSATIGFASPYGVCHGLALQFSVRIGFRSFGLHRWRVGSWSWGSTRPWAGLGPPGCGQERISPGAVSALPDAWTCTPRAAACSAPTPGA